MAKKFKGKGRLTKDQLVKLAAQGKTLAQIAQKDGTTKANVGQKLRRIRQNTVRHIARDENRGKAIVQHNIDAASQLGRINFEVNKLLDQATSEEREIKRLVEVAAVELKKDYEELDPKVAHQLLQKIVTEFHADQDTIFKASAEIREQIKLQLDIFKVWYSHQAIQEFQRVVLDAVRSVDPELGDRIITELRSRRVIR